MNPPPDSDLPSVNSREHFLAEAELLSDCAVLTTEKFRHEELFNLTPNNPSALGLYLLCFRNDAYQIGYQSDHDLPVEDANDIAAIECCLRPVVEGRMREVRGPRRATWQEHQDGVYRSIGTHHLGMTGLVPVPGWRRRASIITYQPYRLGGLNREL